MNSIPQQPLNIATLPTPDSFTNTLQSLKQQMPPVLDDFAKYYVFYHNTPGDTEYQQMYNNIKNNINTINSQLFTLSNSVESNTNTINDNLHNIDKQIQNLKSQNNKLNKKLNGVKEINNSSDELIYNYKQLYDSGYLRNWGLGLSIFVSFTALYLVFKQQNISGSNTNTYSYASK